MALIITQYGLSALADSMISSDDPENPQEPTPITINYIAIGDGGGMPVNFTTDSTGLIGKQYAGTISEYTSVISNGINTITLYMIVPYNTGGYTIREIALYMSENDLNQNKAFAVGNTTEIYKPNTDESDDKINITIRCVLKISSDAAISFDAESESQLLDQKINNAVENKINEFFTNINNYNNIKRLVPEDGNFGDILIKYDKESDNHIWLRKGMMIPNMIKTDENGNNFIN